MRAREQRGSFAPMAGQCFCGCGATIPRFPLGIRSINTRGEQVKLRLDWANDVYAERSEGLEPWFAEGAEWVAGLAAAVHGELDSRSLDEAAVRHWQAYGRNMEKVARGYGKPGVLAWQRSRD